MTVAYTLAMPAPETHLFHVEIRAETQSAPTLDFMMPAWAPGSYMVRDFSRHVQDFEAVTPSGKKLVWTRVDKQTWRVEAGASRTVVVRYKTYANDLSVQTSHLDVTHGYTNGTSTFLYVNGRKEESCRVTVRPYRGWKVDVALPETGRNVFAAKDYDHLADSPMEIGTHRTLEFRAARKRHRVAIYGRGNEDEKRIVADLKGIVEEEAAIFGVVPYDEYLFIVHLTDRPGGGLEHRGSNTSTVERFTFQPGKRYEDFLALEAHEFFHTWNVKRLRPAVLGPFDYTREVHTTLLWAMEGITSYYDHLVLARAGLIREERYRDFLAETITKLRQQPGRFKLSLSESSFLSWIKLYKQDANWVNTGVSYYLKGELIGLALDLAIRDRTRGRKNLDDVMAALFAKYPLDGPGIPEPNGWREALEEVTGLSWRAWFAKHIDGTAEVDFEALLRKVGWTLRPVHKHDKPEEKLKKGEYATPGASLGILIAEVDKRVRVKSVLVGSPAMDSGLNADDELVALNGWQVVDKEWLDKRLREHAPGDVVTLHAFRRHELVEIKLTLGENPPEKWVIEEDKRASAAAKRRRRVWLAPLAGHKAKPRAGGKARAKGSRERVVERGE